MEVKYASCRAPRSSMARWSEVISFKRDVGPLVKALVVFKGVKRCASMKKDDGNEQLGSSNRGYRPAASVALLELGLE